MSAQSQVENTKVAFRRCSHKSSSENFRNFHKKTSELESSFSKIASCKDTTLQILLSAVDISVKTHQNLQIVNFSAHPSMAASENNKKNNMKARMSKAVGRNIGNS